MGNTVVSCVAEHAAANPNRVAVMEHNRATTYGELFSMVVRCSQFLRTQGVKRGDVLVAKASQDLEYAILYLSVHLAGGAIASLERSIPEETMLEIARQLKAAAVIADDFQTETPADFRLIERRNVLAARRDAELETAEIVFPEPDDSADILFTTGTTGKSKGVELTHRALMATAGNLMHGCEYKKDVVLIVPGPLNHANAIRKLYTTFVNGSAVYLLNGMTNLKRFFDALDRTEGTVACCLPPSAIRTLFQLTQDKLGEYAGKIDFIESATAPLPEVDKQKLCELLPGTRLYNNYGLSESASVCMYDYHRYPGKKNCVGKPAQNAEILIVDDQKRPMDSTKDHVGLVACVGDMNMKGYVGEPALTREILLDGVVYTNDVGYIDEEGFVYVIGRKGDVINVGGFKVAPTEVEAAALEYPGIGDCICIPVDDAISGKALKLLAVPEEGRDVSFAEVRKFLSAKLESYKVPHHYERVESIARTYNGKLNRLFYTEK